MTSRMDTMFTVTASGGWPIISGDHERGTCCLTRTRTANYFPTKGKESNNQDKHNRTAYHAG
eukprot:742042-Pyramimonas_sp.AAC.1